jgi:hypothetical protein
MHDEWIVVPDDRVEVVDDAEFGDVRREHRPQAHGSVASQANGFGATVVSEEYWES